MKQVLRTALIAFALTLSFAWNADGASAQRRFGFLNGFEGYWGGIGAPNQWQINGSAGIDVNKGFAASYQNNGFIRGTDGWNALWIRVPPVANSVQSNVALTCSIDAVVRSSGNVANFYFSAFDPENNGIIYGETGPLNNSQLGNGNWVHIGRKFTLPAGRGRPETMGVRLGYWGYGADVWVQVDDVGLFCSTSPNMLNASPMMCNESGCK